MSAAGRPRTRIGHLGKIVTVIDPKTNEWIARSRIRDSDGVARKISARGRTEAIAKADLEELARVRVLRATGVITQDSTISDLVALYLAKLAASTRYAVQTKARYAQSSKLILEKFGGLTIPELTPGKVLTFIEDLAEEHLSEARTARVVLKAIMQRALRSDAIKQNPVTEASVELQVPKKTPRAVTTEDLHRLRTAIAKWRTGPDVKGPKPSSDLGDLLDIMLGTTTRISEALAIRAEDVRIGDDGVLRVEICGTIVWEKGIGTYRQPLGKSDAAHRFITPPDFAADILRYRAHHGEWNLLFATKHGTPFLQQNLGRSLRAIVAGTDLAWITSHVFRKTSATTIDRLAGPDGRKFASRALGHEGETLAGTTYIERDRQVPDARGALDTLAPRMPAPVTLEVSEQ